MSFEDPNKGTIAWFARNPVAANLLLFLMVVGGSMALMSIQKEAEPDYRLEMVQIRVSYPGATPAEVERGICIKIEEAIEGIEGIKEITANAYEGLGIVNAEISWGYEMSEVMDEINFNVAAIFSFPENAEKPIISRVKTRDDVIDVQIYGDIGEMAMTRIAKQVRDEIAALPDVTQVEVNDARDYEISIEVSEVQLQQYGLSLADVAQAVRASSVDLPGGVVKTEQYDIRLRTEGKAYKGSEFEDIVLIKSEDGGRVTVGDVGTVTDGFVEDPRSSLFNGEPSISLSVYSVANESDLKIAAAVTEYVAEKQLSLPEGAYIDTWADGSYYLKGRLNMMLKNLGMGSILVFILLGLFLRLKVAFWVVVGIPVSFLGAIWLMPQFDVTINMISLFGFILVLGILVDDAIVIGENVHSYVEENGHSIDNVIRGAKQVAMPATFGVLTTIAAFMPMTAVTSPSGPLWKAIGFVVVAALAFSLVESKWVLPAHLRSLAKPPKPNAKRGFIERIQDKIDSSLAHFVKNYYRPALDKLLAYRYATLAGFIGLLMIAIGSVSGGIIRFVFFPEMPSDYIWVRLEMGAGSSFNQLRHGMDEIEGAMNDIDAELLEKDGGALVKHSRAWLNGRDRGFMFIELLPSETRTLGSEQIARMWSDRLPDIPGAENIEIQGAGGGGGPAIGMNLVSEDLDDLEAVSDIMVKKLRTYTGVYNVRSSLSEGPPEAVLSIKPEAEALGLTLADIASQARHGFYGFEVQRVQRGEDEVRVMVRYPQEERKSLHDLETMRFRTRTGEHLPFAAVAEIDFQTGYSYIRRIGGKRSVNINAAADKAVAEPGKISEEIREYFTNEVQPQYPSVGFMAAGQSKEEQESLAQLFRGFGLSLLVIYGLMAIPLRSYVQPLMIMSVIPFGFIGAVFGHWILGLSVSILSLFGLVALAGVVVNDSLVMVDFVNQGKKRGMAVIEAAKYAGARRFRAILLTSLTTFIGLIPIIAEKSMQAQIVIPMAVSLAFGIIFSTVVTLFLIPTLYLIIDDISRGLSKLFKRKTEIEVGDSVVDAH